MYIFQPKRTYLFILYLAFVQHWKYFKTLIVCISNIFISNLNTLLMKTTRYVYVLLIFTFII